MSGPLVAVVGGGPAGLSAAAAAARTGARVRLFDEGLAPGGQLRYRSGSVQAAVDGDWEPPTAMAVRLEAEAVAAGAVVSARAVVWSLFDDGSIAVATDGNPLLLQPAVVVVATGSTDLPFPFPGGSLPGVFSARAVLLAINTWRIRPGRRWAMVGEGPERDEVEEAITRAGGEVTARAEPAAGDTIAAEGSVGIEAVVVNGRRIAVDCIAVAAGRQPDAALAAMAGCALGPGPDGDLVPVVDAFGRSTAGRVFVAGDAAGICSPAVAMAEGRLAGLAAAAAIGCATDDQLRDALERERGVLADRRAVRSDREPTYVQPYR